MTPPEKISLLVMRDNGESRRIRMRRSLLLFLLFFCVIMPFVAAGGIWFSVDTWMKYQKLQQNSHLMEREYQKAQATATRLANLEQLLQRRDAAEVAVVTRNISLAEAGKTAEAEASGATPDSADNIEGPGHSEFPATNTGFVTVENTTVRLMPGKKLRISLDLVNPDSRKTISGKVSCVLSPASGETLPLETTPPAAGDFRIARLKRAVLVAPLPPSTSAANAQVIIEVRNDGGEIMYRNIFPVAR